MAVADHVAMVVVRWQGTPRFWNTRSETHVYPGTVVIFAELFDDVTQMAFAERDHEIETLAM